MSNADNAASAVVSPTVLERFDSGYRSRFGEGVAGAGAEGAGTTA